MATSPISKSSPILPEAISQAAINARRPPHPLESRGLHLPNRQNVGKSI